MPQRERGNETPKDQERQQPVMARQISRGAVAKEHRLAVLVATSTFGARQFIPKQAKKRYQRDSPAEPHHDARNRTICGNPAPTAEAAPKKTHNSKPNQPRTEHALSEGKTLIRRHGDNQSHGKHAARKLDDYASSPPLAGRFDTKAEFADRARDLLGLTTPAAHSTRLESRVAPHATEQTRLDCKRWRTTLSARVIALTAG